MKLILYSLAFSLVAVVSCKKEPDYLFFEVNNVHDVAITSGQRDSLILEVKQLDGDNSKVNLSLSGLPEGVTGSFTPSAGTPSFSTTLRLQVDILAKPGEYPLVISAASEQVSKSYDLVLRISQGNYWKVKDEVYRPKGYSSFSSGNYNTIIATDSAGHSISFEFYNGFPANTGSYQLINFPVAENQVAITAANGSHSYISSGGDGKNASIQVSGTSTTISAMDFRATSISSANDSVSISCFIRTGG